MLVLKLSQLMKSHGDFDMAVAVQFEQSLKDFV